MIRIHKAIGETKKGYKTIYKTHYWFTLHAKNGRVLTTSEMYTRHSNCMKGVYSLLEIVRDGRVKIKDETKKD